MYPELLHTAMQPLLLALSGGIDSMVLAHLLRSRNIPFEVAHADFGLRGEESDADRRFVEDWCKGHDIVCHVHRFNTRAEADASGESIQETARKLRYAWFETLRQQRGLKAIATAHHQDDSVETLLFHFFRGTGLRGLCGIPDRQGKVVRPLQRWTRAQVMAYAKEQSVPFREDSSNASAQYTRNKLRHDVLPRLEEVFPSVRQNLSGNLERFGEAYALYHAEVERYRRKLLDWRGREAWLPIRKLKNIPALATLLHEFYAPYGFSGRAEELKAMTKAHPGAVLHSVTHRLIRHGDFLILTSAATAASGHILIQEGEQETHAPDFRLNIRTMTMPDRIPALGPEECYADADQLQYPLLLRPWKPGDYFYPFGMKKKKKIARLLIDARVPVHEKEKVWVLESAGRILWVVGVRADERFRVGPKTRQVLAFTLHPKQ